MLAVRDQMLEYLAWNFYRHALELLQSARSDKKTGNEKRGLILGALLQNLKDKAPVRNSLVDGGGGEGGLCVEEKEIFNNGQPEMGEKVLLTLTPT